MTEHIFGELIRDWRRATAHLHHHAVTMTANPAVQTPQGAPMSLKELATDIQTALEDGESHIRTVLDQHMPTLAALAEQVENDPLIQAAEAAALPPGARAIVADFISKIAAEFPQAPTTPQAPEAPEVPAEPLPEAAPQPA